MWPLHVALLRLVGSHATVVACAAALLASARFRGVLAPAADESGQRRGGGLPRYLPKLALLARAAVTAAAPASPNPASARSRLQLSIVAAARQLLGLRSALPSLRNAAA